MAKVIDSQHPREMYLLAITEICQRFAFWGTANLLVIYLVQYHRFRDARADMLFGIFTGAAFILPLLGGYIADRWNYRSPIIYGILSSALGCFFLATGSLSLLYIALFLTAIGTSIFTPSIYTILGGIYVKKHHLRESGFTIYYAAVNIGVFAALIILGAFGQGNHWGFAFFIAGIVQLMGLIPFYRVLRSPFFLSLDLSKENRNKSKNKKLPTLKTHEKRRILMICILSLFSIMFWMAYNQGGSSMSLFALRYTDRYIANFQMPASWLLSSENLFLILLAFPLSGLYIYLRKIHKDPSPIVKCALSLFAIGVCYAIMYAGSLNIPMGAKSATISPAYLFSAYFLMALGEMLICPIGLSLITHLSPHRYTAFLVGVWYVCIGIAFYLGGMAATLMSRFNHLSAFFNIFVIASFIPAIILLLFAKRLNKMRHLEKV